MFFLIIECIFFYCIRYTHCSDVPVHVQRDVELHLLEYQTDKTPTTSSGLSNLAKIHLQFDSDGKKTLQQQYEILSCVPNFHWGKYPSVRGDKVQGSGDVSLMRHIAFQPSEGNEKSKFIPTSVRSRLIYFNVKKRRTEMNTLIYYIFFDKLPCVPLSYPEQSTTIQVDNCRSSPDCAPLPPKRKRTMTRSRVTVDMLQKELQRSEHSRNMSLVRPTMYQDYVSKILSTGVIKWRKFSPHVHIFVLNDYSQDTGTFQSEAFVHSKLIVRNLNAICVCSCNTYRMLNAMASMQEQSVDDETSCMHSRFLIENLSVILNIAEERDLDASNRVDMKFVDALSSAGKRLVPVDSSEQRHRSLSFSVLCEEGNTSSCALVNLCKERKFIRCLNGECQARYNKKRSVKRLFSLHEATAICNHLCIMKAHREEWMPEQLDASGDEEFDEDLHILNTDNVEDLDLFQNVTTYFRTANL